MDEPNIYTDLKQSIETHFSFLKDHGFSDFEENQLAYEMHFETKNDFVSIDIWFEATHSTPIWAKINQYHIDTLEPQNPIVKNYSVELKENYDDLFQQYLQTNKKKFLYKIAEQYAINGKELNDKYLKELSQILKRHLSVLKGDVELVKSNAEILHKEHELRIAKERIKNKIYTLEYNIFLSSEFTEYEFYEEFTALEDIRHYLSERDEIKKYRILDWNMDEIKLEHS